MICCWIYIWPHGYLQEEYWWSYISDIWEGWRNKCTDENKKKSEEDKADIYAFRNNEAELTEAQKKEEEMPEEYVITDFTIIDQMTESSVERKQL